MTSSMRAAVARTRRVRPSIDPTLGTMVLLAVLSVPWFLYGPGGRTTSWALQVLLDGLVVYFATRLYRLDRARRYPRRFWLSVVVGAGCCTIGDAYQTALVISRPAETGASLVQTAMVVAGMLVVLVTTLRHPLGGTGRQRLRLWLDAATVLAAVAVFLWYYLLAGQLGGPGTARSVAAATTALLLLMTFGLLKLIFSQTAPFTRSAGFIASLGVAGTAVAAPVAATLTGGSDPPVLILVQLLPCLLIPMSLRLQELQIRKQRARTQAVARRGFSRLPYAAVVATQILLLVAIPELGRDLRVWGVSAGVVLITALVLGRQLFAFQDNERLLDQLDESVRQLNEQKEWFSSLVQHAFDITLVTGVDGLVQYASPAVERVLGVSAASLPGKPLSAWAHPDDEPLLRTVVDRLTATPGTDAQAELRLRHADGTYRWLHLIGTDLTGNPHVRGTVWNARDVTEAKRLQDELRHQATHDPLTGLANRALLQQRLREADPANQVGVLLLDLDGFKQINDRYGHQAGDRVLVTVAQRLAAMLGTTGTAARLGGDEFAVIVPDFGVAEVQALGERITADLRAPILVADSTFGGTFVAVGASVGAAAGIPAEADRVLHEADLAMYRCKNARRSPTLAA